MRRVPRGASVVALFGEIDCREGLLLCVERGKYPDVKAGAEATVALYVQVLLKLAADRDLTIYVHPARSVARRSPGACVALTARVA